MSSAEAESRRDPKLGRPINMENQMPSASTELIRDPIVSPPEA